MPLKYNFIGVKYSKNEHSITQSEQPDSCGLVEEINQHVYYIDK